MVEVLMLQARGTLATWLTVVAVGAVNVLGCGSRQSQLGYSGMAMKEQGMWHAVVVDHVAQPCYGLPIAYDVAKFHRLKKM